MILYARWIAVGLYVAITLVSIMMMRHRRRWVAYVPILLVGVHGMLFYVTVWAHAICQCIDVTFINSWSTGLRIHEIITILMLLFIRRDLGDRYAEDTF